jgi:hypothetical protein
LLAGRIFFTVTLRDRSADVLVRHVGLLREAFRTVRAELGGFADRQSAIIGVLTLIPLTVH